MIPDVSDMASKPERPLSRLNKFLDEHVLRYPIEFLTNRIIILATLAMLLPLLFYTSNQVFVNVLNSYLNVMSVVVGSTVLLYATIADVRDRAAAKRAEEIARAYEQVLEERVREREEIAKAYEQKLEERVLGQQQELEERLLWREEMAKAYEQKLEERVLGQQQELEERVLDRERELEERVRTREEIAKAYEQKLEKRVQADHELIEQILQNSIENILGARLEKIRLEDHKQLDAMQKAVIASNESLRTELAEKALIASNESLRAELAELSKLVQAIYKNQYRPSSPSSS
jgi:flagellar biosynthesis GTPase FlhF